RRPSGASYRPEVASRLALPPAQDPALKSAPAQMGYLVKQLKGTKVAAQVLPIYQCTVVRHVKGALPPDAWQGPGQVGLPAFRSTSAASRG
ncbi:hypothetical protein ABZ841_39035, partial [Streptomyces flaveolus]